MQIRHADTRGKAEHGWLTSFHSFSFAEFYDPNYMGYSVLRVLNDDVIAGGTGFGMHPHRDMEIVTYMLSGQLRHRDTMGNTSVISAGDIQRMTAGSGLMHSEFNASSEHPVHLLQIWIHPNQRGLTPDYEEMHVPQEEKINQWRLIVSSKAGAGHLSIHQDVDIFSSELLEGYDIGVSVEDGRVHYLHVATGEVNINGKTLETGGALMLSANEKVTIRATQNSEMLLFDLPETH